MVQMAYICVPLVFWNTSYGKFLISQRVLKWITKTSTLCIVVAYTPQVYFLVTFLKKKKKKKGQPSGSSDRSISLWTNYRGML